MDDHGVTVRNYFRTYRINWAEVSRFADGAGLIPAEGKAPWALAIVLHGVWKINASCTAWDTGPSQKMLTEIRDAADAHGIPAVLTGVPGRRFREGQ
jgi:hypothetical protein